MKSIIKFAAAVVLIVTAVGCANLTEIREFADESAKFSAYTELTARFRDTYQRERLYISGEAQLIAEANDRKRQDAYQDLLKLHQTVSTYMQTLATLAGEETFELSKGIDSLASGIKAYPDFGIEEKHTDAFSNISKVISKWITSASQEKAVREMVKNGDAHLQTVLDGMLSLVRCYRKTNENERKSVIGFFEMETMYADTPKDRLLFVLANVHLQQKICEYQLADTKFSEAEKGIKSIKDGHRKILENIDKLSSAELKTIIKKISRDIKVIRENLRSIRS